jgi:hypothetical protein
MGGLIADILIMLRRARLDALQFELSSQTLSDLRRRTSCIEPPPTFGDAPTGAMIHAQLAIDDTGPG